MNPAEHGQRRAEEAMALQPLTLDLAFYAPDGTPWCRFYPGTVDCVNGSHCLNPRHRHGRLDPYDVSNHIRRNQFGHYLLVNPETGKEEAFPRVTTIAGTQDDTYGLNQWQLRQLAWGMSQRGYLVDRAGSADGPDDRAVLEEVVREALTVAGTSEKAHVGSTLHGLTQKIDRGDSDVRIPDQHRDRIIRYKTLVSAFGFRWYRDLIEAIIFLTTPTRIAGAIDRVAQWHRSELPIITDLKTGSLDYSKVKIAQQLALYAHAQYLWDPRRQAATEAPRFNREIGLVIWLPAMTDDEPKVYQVDLEEGWALAQRSLDVRDTRRTKGKHLFTEIKADATPTLDAMREELIRTRVTRLVEAGYAAILLDKWDPNVPTLKEGGLTEADLDLVEGWCAEVERQAA